jgi:ornithine carbamoyltransferase
MRFRIGDCRPKFQPPLELLERAGGRVRLTNDPLDAASGAHMLYTDVWVSMEEEEAAYRLAQFQGYQINQEAVDLASSDALVMHCLPAYRGKEIDETTLEAHADTIFRQAENRLHTQKAIMARLSKEWRADR